MTLDIVQNDYVYLHSPQFSTIDTFLWNVWIFFQVFLFGTPKKETKEKNIHASGTLADLQKKSEILQKTKKVAWNLSNSLCFIHVLVFCFFL